MIEELKSEEAAELLPLNAVVQALHVRNHPGIFRGDAPEEALLAYFRSVIDTPGGMVLVDRRDGRAVGYVLCMIDERPENPFMKPLRFGHLQQIAVLPDWQRRGVARGLVREARTRFAKAGLREWRASWYMFNDASGALMASEGLEPMLQVGRGRLTDRC